MYLQEEDVEDGVEGGVEVSGPEDRRVDVSRSLQNLTVKRISLFIEILTYYF